MGEREKIVAWLRAGNVQLALPSNDEQRPLHLLLADAIEAGEHLKRPEPTVPAEQWREESNVGH